MVRLFDWHRKKLYKPFKKKFGLNGYQMCWISFGKGILIGTLPLESKLRSKFLCYNLRCCKVFLESSLSFLGKCLT